MSGTLAVISPSGHTLNFFDLSSGERTAQVTGLVAEPHELCYDEKRNLIYVSHAYRHGHFWVHADNSHEITIVDPEKKEIADIIDIKPYLAPHGLVLDKKRDMLLVSYEEHTDTAGGGVIGIDLNTKKVVKHVKSEAKTHWFVVTPDGKKVYTCNKTATFVSILDLENERMLGKIDIPQGTEEPSISPDGKFAYFPTPSCTFGPAPEDSRIEVIDTATDKIVKSIPIDEGAFSTHTTPSGAIMVGKYNFENKQGEKVRAGPGRLGLYHPDTHALVGDVGVQVSPLTLRCSPDGSLGFVANMGTGRVTVIDLASMKVLKSLDVDTVPAAGNPAHQGAHGMLYFP
jgi:DNA-binding beta-propeller fold protein YncE